MDAFEILTKDHRTVDGIFDKIEQLGGNDAHECERLFEQLRSALEIHTEAEEQIFYPEMKKHAATNAFVEEAVEAHAEVKDLLEEIGELPADDEEWPDKIEELKHAVQQHVREEEGELFPNARNALDRSRAEELGREILEMKQKAGA